MISVRVPATSANLGPGYDAVGLALSLSMRVGLERSPHPEIEIRGTGAGLIPRGPEHPAYRAARFVAELVGGAVAANELFGGQIAPPDLLNIVCELDGHPDNAAPALLGGLVIGTLTPVGVRSVRLEPKDLKVVVAVLRPPPRRPRHRRIRPPACSHARSTPPTLPRPPHTRSGRRDRGGVGQWSLRRVPLRLGPDRPRLRPARKSNHHSLGDENDLRGAGGRGEVMGIGRGPRRCPRRTAGSGDRTASRARPLEPYSKRMNLSE